MRRSVFSSLAARGAAAFAVGGALLVALGGCEVKDSGNDLVNGKQLFTQRCAACHTLARAGTTGVTGPNLDDAFRQAVRDGFGRDTIKGVVEKQILFPARNGVMPANLVTGEDAEDVAAYVSQVAAAPGEDTGALATAVPKPGAGKPLAAKGGELQIDADPSGALAFLGVKATAPAGKLTIRSQNKSSVGHNIAIEGSGVDAKGKVVKNGGVSEVTVDLKPGTYTFYCSVPGHREGGMKGTLTVR